MIDFYKEWKDAKEYSKEPPKQKANSGIRCKICDKAINGLRDHVSGAHGVDMWDLYLAAEAQLKQQELQKFIKLL